MPPVTILVPKGAEAAAVRRAHGTARVIEIAAGGSAGASLPALDPETLVVVTGLCGALGTLKAGDVVVYSSVRDGARTIILDAEIVRALAAAFPSAKVAAAYTADRVVTRTAERAALLARFGAGVVDMEGTHVAGALAARGTRYAMIRVVSDDATRDLPPIGDAIDVAGRIRPVLLARGFARAPLAAARFVRDVRAALGVLTRMTRGIDAIQR